MRGAGVWCRVLVVLVVVFGGECVCCRVGMCEVDAKGCKCEWRKSTAIFYLSFSFWLRKNVRRVVLVLVVSVAMLDYVRWMLEGCKSEFRDCKETSDSGCWLFFFVLLKEERSGSSVGVSG